MAVRQPTATQFGNNAGVSITWTGLLQGDNGDAVDYSNFINKTFHVFGTFGGATITCQGSNDGVNWAPLSDVTGNNLSLTSTKPMRRTDDIPRYVRPLVAGGDGTTSLTVVVVGMAYNPGGGR
jgi:hypothetical protein